MNGIFAHELSKAGKNKWFAIALVIGCILAIVAAAEAIITVDALYRSMSADGEHYGLDATTFLGLSTASSYGNWMAVNANVPLSSTVFFYLAPLLTAIPFSWSYQQERDSYLAHALLRRTRTQAYGAKAAASFLVGGTVVALPLVLNFIIVSCFLPAYMPHYNECNYTGMFYDSYFSWFFYNAPLVFVALFTLLDFCLAGCWAVLCLAISTLFRNNRVATLVVPYLGLLAWVYLVPNIVFANVQGFSTDLIHCMMATHFSDPPEPLAAAALLVALPAASFVLFLCEGRRDVL